MPLNPGHTLSFYEILGPLGAGAMGEVYRAKDTRLDREVAIKVLPEHFAEDEERLRRLEREARSLAALNHPNVAPIFSVDQVEDTCFLVLELVPNHGSPGDDLRRPSLRRGTHRQVALSVARRIARCRGREVQLDIRRRLEKTGRPCLQNVTRLLPCNTARWNTLDARSCRSSDVRRSEVTL
jgi:serine/threonine protein kinase